jgi:hypothetical protein
MLHGTVDIVAGANYASWFQAQAKGTVSLKVLASGTVCAPTTFGVLALPSWASPSPRTWRARPSPSTSPTTYRR